jgi:hypothetical protein
LTRRKQALVAESDLNRVALRLEYERLRVATARLDGAMATARRLGPWLLPAVSVAGVFTARFLRKGSGAVGKVTSLLRWVAPALALWRRFGARRRADAGN